MTHFTVGILLPAQQLSRAEDYIAQQMAPYDEDEQVEPYICYDEERAASDLAKEIADLELVIALNPPGYDIERCRRRLDHLQQTSPADRYREFLQYHERFDEAGRPLSTYNPQSRWDWYIVGGRWDGWLLDREAEDEAIADNSAPVPQVIDQEKWTYALITPDGRWHERGKLSYWAHASHEKDEAVWHDELRQLLERYLDHHLILIDAHI